ncbi:MAG: LPS translocon maturation chaperone LptM [Gammaproteobacteria bacterium]
MRIANCLKASRPLLGFAILAGACALGGCGQSGPLYLPPPAKHAPPPAAKHAPAPATAATTAPTPATSSR